MSQNLKRLVKAGVSIWLDDISRERLRSGNLAVLMRERQVTGVTSNPTIFAAALSKGDAYRDQIRDLAVRGIGPEEAARAITTYDIRWAADVLRPVYDATQGIDGRVSIEVDPRLARNPEATIAEARMLWWTIDRPNLLIKIPATQEGLSAITQAISEGISVNVTLIFSLERYRAVVDAYRTGLEQARATGRDLSEIASVASFFVSRVDTAVDARLDALGTEESAALRGTVAVANARLAYRHHQESLRAPEWRELLAAGARPQRPLWASTGVKDPAYPDTLYVDHLVAPGVVNTMPRATLEAVADHGTAGEDTVTGAYDDAEDRLRRLAALGVDLDDVTARLEVEGVDKFVASWDELLGTVRAGLEAAR